MNQDEWTEKVHRMKVGAELDGLANRMHVNALNLEPSRSWNDAMCLFEDLGGMKNVGIAWSNTHACDINRRFRCEVIAPENPVADDIVQRSGLGYGRTAAEAIARAAAIVMGPE